MTVLLDDRGIWAQNFRVAAYPTAYYIDSDGILAKTVVGQQSNEMIIDEMNKVH